VPLIQQDPFTELAQKFKDKHMYHTKLQLKNKSASLTSSNCRCTWSDRYVTALTLRHSNELGLQDQTALIKKQSSVCLYSQHPIPNSASILVLSAQIFAHRIRQSKKKIKKIKTLFFSQVTFSKQLIPCFCCHHARKNTEHGCQLRQQCHRICSLTKAGDRFQLSRYSA